MVGRVVRARCVHRPILETKVEEQRAFVDHGIVGQGGLRQLMRTLRPFQPGQHLGLNGGNAGIAQPASGQSRLPQTRFIQSDIDMPLNATLRIPLGFTVANEVNLGQIYPTLPPTLGLGRAALGIGGNDRF